MPLPIVTITIFEVILIRRESAHGLGGTVTVSCISSASGRSIARFETARNTRTDANTAGATNRCNPRLFEERNVSLDGKPPNPWTACPAFSTWSSSSTRVLEEIHPMGHPIGGYSEKELKGLSKRQRAALKKEALRHLRTSPEIHKIINTQPRYLTEHPKIRRALRTKLRRTYNRLKSK